MSAEHDLTRSRLESENTEPLLTVSSNAAESLLDSIMQQTAAAFDDRTLAQTIDLPRLREVASRHASDSLTLDPVMIELIEAVLETHLPPSLQSSGFKTKVARAVAQPLFDNPVSRGRLELLWSQLLDDIQ